MKSISQMNYNRRSFFKNAGLLSLGISIPALVKPAEVTRAQYVNDQVIEIRTGNQVAVLISVFHVEPENEQKLIALFEEGTAMIFSKQPGYISSSIHKASDSKQLVLYGQWENKQHIDAFRKRPDVGEYFKKIKELATFESIVCNDIPFVHHK